MSDTKFIEALTAKLDENINANALHGFLRKRKQTPAMVAALPAKIRERVYSVFENDPAKRREVQRLMDNPNS